MADRFATWAARIVDDPRDAWVARLLSLLPERADILELGCGAGVERTPTLASRGRLVGVDISGEQLARARRAVPTVRYVHDDLVGVRFQEESFDAVVSLYVLTHVPTSELPALLCRIGRWLRPGGHLLATFGGSGTHDSRVDDWLGVPMFFAGYDAESNERLVRGAGLELVDSRLETMHEPPSEPGGPAETATFHWVLARRS